MLAGTQRVINRRTRNNLAILYNKQSGQIITLSHNLLSIKYCFYQIEVFYSPFSEDLGSGDRGIGRLYPNVKVTPHQHHDGLSQPPPQGCGYPPSLQCVPFFEEFGAPGQNFSCFVSSMDPGVVIHSLDISEVIMIIIKSQHSTIISLRFTRHWFTPSSFPFACSACPPSI